jgi:hypothetical protein
MDVTSDDMDVEAAAVNAAGLPIAAAVVCRGWVMSAVRDSPGPAALSGSGKPFQVLIQPLLQVGLPGCQPNCSPTVHVPVQLCNNAVHKMPPEGPATTVAGILCLLSCYHNKHSAHVTCLSNGQVKRHADEAVKQASLVNIPRHCGVCRLKHWTEAANDSCISQHACKCLSVHTLCADTLLQASVTHANCCWVACRCCGTSWALGSLMQQRGYAEHGPAS